MSDALPLNRRTTHGRRRLLAVALGVAATATLAAGWVDHSILCLIPAIALALLFALRGYAGEDVLSRLARARRPRRRPRLAATRSAARHEATLPRGGLLLAFSLAVRPPPRGVRAAA